MNVLPIAESFERVTYEELNGTQQEVYNFSKAASLLATYGFECARIQADSLGADFLAHHMVRGTVLAVQLKGRVTIHKKYLDNPDLWIMCPVDSGWLLIPHVTLVKFVKDSTRGGLEKARSWQEDGYRHMKKPSAKLRELIDPWLLSAEAI